MSEQSLDLLIEAAKKFDVKIYQINQSTPWLFRRSGSAWDPRFDSEQAFVLMVAMRAEVQYLDGFNKAVITSNDGRLSFSLSYGTCVETATKALVCTLAIELVKRKK